jgi:TonB family protein
MKSLALITVLAVLISNVAAEKQVRRDGTYVYRDDELQWDKKAFDAPPAIIGGYRELVQQFSYPDDLRRRRIQGSATVTLSVDSAGGVSSVSFSPRMPPDLERLITTAVRKCRWKPGRRGGRPVAGHVWFPATFVLHSP